MTLYQAIYDAYRRRAPWTCLGLPPPVTRLRNDCASHPAGNRAMRARDLGIRIGLGTPGPLNAITDVAEVTVGHTTLIRGDGPLVVGKGPCGPASRSCAHGARPGASRCSRALTG